MSLKYAVLAALLEGEASGYDLAKVFDVSVANFWSATPSSSTGNWTGSRRSA